MFSRFKSSNLQRWQRLACYVFAWSLICVTAMIVCGMCVCRTPAQGVSVPWKPTGQETPASLKSRTSAINRPKETGQYYEATVPDTLDLAERARWGINHFTSIISEKNNFMMYWRGDFDKVDMYAWPGYIWESNSDCQPKAMEAMAMERLMSGSQQNLEREAKMLEMMVAHLGKDGPYYNLHLGKDGLYHNLHPTIVGPNDKFQVPRDRQYVHYHGQGRMLRAMIAWYQYTGDSAWKERIDRMVDGLDRLIVVHKGDYAYFPLGDAEPETEKKGEEGSLFNNQGHIPGALANWYMLTGNKQALRLSGELVRFYTKPKFWADWPAGEYPGVVGTARAHWQGHFHGHINTLRAILEYALATNDSRLKQFVRDGYEWARQSTLARIGIVGDAQGCACGRLIGLAIKLSDAGVGDYWEDVDLYIRNQGSAGQFTPADIPRLTKLLEKNANEPGPVGVSYPWTNLNVVEAAIGGFTMQYIPFKTGWALCCSPHGNMGLFYAWEGTLRYADGVARINLLLNRASPWIDLDSYLPYEGRVVLKNKKAKEVFVRVPLWVDLGAVKCRAGRRPVKPEWFGRYLRVEKLKAGDVVTVEFPMVGRTERWSTATPTGYALPTLPANVVYTMEFKGNTLVEIDQPFAAGEWIYQDGAKGCESSRAPTKIVRRFVTDGVLKW